MLALKCERLRLSLILPKVSRVQTVIIASWQTTGWLKDESPFQLQAEGRTFILIIGWFVSFFL
jgi:hypothetical protein